MGDLAKRFFEGKTVDQMIEIVENKQFDKVIGPLFTKLYKVTLSIRAYQSTDPNTNNLTERISYTASSIAVVNKDEKLEYFKAINMQSFLFDHVIKSLLPQDEQQE